MNEYTDTGYYDYSPSYSTHGVWYGLCECGRYVKLDHYQGIVYGECKCGRELVLAIDPEEN